MFCVTLASKKTFHFLTQAVRSSQAAVRLNLSSSALLLRINMYKAFTILALMPVIYALFIAFMPRFKPIRTKHYAISLCLTMIFLFIGVQLR
jgi:hypothetical protein